jgi:hypothetical protein
MRREPFAGLPPGHLGLSKTAWSFDGVLRRVIGFSRAATLEPRPSSRRSPSSVKLADRSSSTAFDALRLFVRTLDAPTLTKLGTLMQAGRDGQALGVTHALRAPTMVEPVSGPSSELFTDGTASLDYVQRGHAIACATEFDLESDVAAWADSSHAGSLEERVWLRFGRELAAASPGEWSCLAAVGSKDELEGIFLRRGSGAWWSFDGVVDRPSLARVAARRSRKRSQSPLISLSLDAVVGQKCRPDRRALRRAVLALSARLGCCRVTAHELLGGA